MYKTKYIHQLLVLLIALFFSLASHASTEIDFDNANNLIHKAHIGIEHESTKIRTLEKILSDIKLLNYQATHCVQDEKKQLDNIATLEADSEIPELRDKNSKDAIYIQNKKKIHYEKSSKCRLLAFKTQDLSAELSQTIRDRKNQVKEDTLIGSFLNLINSKQNSASAFGLLVFFIFLLLASKIVIARGRIRGIYLNQIYKRHEIRLLNFSLYSLIVCWLAIFLFQFFELSSVNASKTVDFVLNGTMFYGFKIIPMRLLIALLTFSIIQIAGKYFVVRVSEQPKFEDEAKTQIVIGALMTYIVFTIALLSALLISGVDLTNLAIIAGALSVGIGLGLQDIVNNFVAGLILLIEKPIRLNDRIKINGVEGFVKEINIRSTRIMTLLKESVIIPNSEFVKNQITNYVFNDTTSQLICKLCVSYDNDFELVKNTLIGIAENHPDIAKDMFNKPFVVIKEFSVNGVNVELSCVVNDVNRQYMINSEINFMIIKMFRENNIVLAYPQLSVHIPSDSGPTNFPRRIFKG